MDAIVIGAGQAGLAASYHLTQQEVPHVVLERNERIGDQWRNRWDSLKLFTSTGYNNLPGAKFPGKKGVFPHKDVVADFFEDYAGKFDLPVQCGVSVNRVSKGNGRIQVDTDRESLETDNVIVATGAFQKPYTPRAGKDLNPDVFQVHSSQYKNPDQLKPGNVLVVGTGNSGVQIAEELSATHDVTLSGREINGLPRKVLGKDIFWWFLLVGFNRVRVDSKIGKKMKAKRWGKGDPLVGRKLPQVVEQFGLKRCGKVQGVDNGEIVLENGERIPQPDNVVWATGFRPDFQWIDQLQVDDYGYPNHYRGVVQDFPGLYFLGLKLLYRVNSSLIHGVGDDARYTAGHIAQRR